MANEILIQLNFWIFLTEPVLEVQFLFPAAMPFCQVWLHYLQKKLDLFNLITGIHCIFVSYLYNLLSWVSEVIRNRQFIRTQNQYEQVLQEEYRFHLLSLKFCPMGCPANICQKNFEHHRWKCLLLLLTSSNWTSNNDALLQRQEI